MHITLLADASHCPDTKAGGYGFWIASERGKRGGGGQLKGRILTSTLAEMMAVANAIYEGVAHHLIQPNDILLIQIDCEAAIFAFNKTRQVSDIEEKVVLYIDKLSKSMNLKLQFKHVKGHSSKKESRFAANNACDRAARKHMRRARTTVRLEEAKSLLENSRMKNETIS